VSWLWGEESPELIFAIYWVVEGFLITRFNVVVRFFTLEFGRRRRVRIDGKARPTSQVVQTSRRNK